jgi:hypothetical protein
VNTFFASTPADWRAWLAQNCRSEKEVWLVIYHTGSGTPSVRYHEAIAHALCYGWIDSQARKRNADSSCLRFTPRNSRSTWSRVNRQRARKMIELGLMTEHGQALIELARAGEPGRSCPTRRAQPYPMICRNCSAETRPPARTSRISAILETVDPGVGSDSALQRARKMIDSAAPTQQTVLRDLGDEAIGVIVTRWADAWQAGDAGAIAALLAANARYSMPPLPEWYRGRDEIRAFLLRGPLQSHWRFLPTTANGQLAFGTYLRDDTAGLYVPGGLDVLTIQSGHVAEVTAFLTADLTRFRLPARIRP